MLEVDTPAALDAHAGAVLGAGDWLEVTQAMIDAFADTTGDRQWIHVDPERARTGMPGGRTVAHGYLTLSLLPQLARSVFTVRHRSRVLNYGLNRVRFTAPVPSGGAIRAHQVLKACDPIEGGRRLTLETTVEIQHHDRPALIAETISLYFDEIPQGG